MERSCWWWIVFGGNQEKGKKKAATTIKTRAKPNQNKARWKQKQQKAEIHGGCKLDCNFVHTNSKSVPNETKTKQEEGENSIKQKQTKQQQQQQEINKAKQTNKQKKKNRGGYKLVCNFAHTNSKSVPNETKTKQEESEHKTEQSTVAGN